MNTTRYEDKPYSIRTIPETHASPMYPAGHEGQPHSIRTIPETGASPMKPGGREAQAATATYPKLEGEIWGSIFKIQTSLIDGSVPNTPYDQLLEGLNIDENADINDSFTSVKRDQNLIKKLKRSLKALGV